MQQQAQQVKQGDRVIIHGLKGRPELNNQSAVLVGPAANGRVNVRLDSGDQIALKQENLGLAAPGGGMPGGGMPGGMGGGMPGMGAGMPDPQQVQAMAEQMIQQVRQSLASFGINLPESVGAGHVAAGLLISAFLLFYLVTWVFSLTGMAVVGLVVFWGTQTVMGRAALAPRTVMGRKLSPQAQLGALCLVTAVGAYVLLGGSSVSNPAPSSVAGRFYQDEAIHTAINQAYDKGYADSEAGLDKRPPTQIPLPDPAAATDATASTGSSSTYDFVMGLLQPVFKYGLAALYVFKIGNSESGWSHTLAMQSAKADPLKAVMVALLLVLF